MKSKVCQNPWKEKKCKGTDIAVYVLYEERLHPLCWKCWRRIADSNKEW